MPLLVSSKKKEEEIESLISKEFRGVVVRLSVPLLSLSFSRSSSSSIIIVLLLFSLYIFYLIHGLKKESLYSFLHLLSLSVLVPIHLLPFFFDDFSFEAHH